MTIPIGLKKVEYAIETHFHYLMRARRGGAFELHGDYLIDELDVNMHITMKRSERKPESLRPGLCNEINVTLVPPEAKVRSIVYQYCKKSLVFSQITINSEIV